MTLTHRRTRRPTDISARPGRSRVAAPAPGARAVLVPVDGSDASHAALKLARWMEQRGEWAPEAVTVLEPIPVSVADLALPMPVAVEHLVNESVVDQIGRQVKRHGAAHWKLGVQFGRVAPAIVEFARERKSSLIVLGLGKHSRIARVFGAETAARVARLSDVPVLAVPPHALGAPRRVLVAMDFGSSALNATREALRLVERPARLHLLHVRWAFEGQTMRDVEWERTYADGVEIGFARLIDELGPQPGVRITSEMRLGPVLETILETARKMKAQLIAAGSHNQGLVDRVLIGSTPAHLLRAANGSVLIAPPT